MSAHNYNSLLGSLAPDARVLLLGEPDEALELHVTQLERAAVDVLPDGDARYELIVCRCVTHDLPDAYDLLRQRAELLETGGWLLVEDVLMPDDERASYYVEAFYRLRSGTRQRYYAAYAWEGMLLDAGLRAAWQETDDTRLMLLDWAGDCSDYVIERLQILLKQAPTAVADWLRPAAVGKADASFRQHRIRITAQKPTD